RRGAGGQGYAMQSEEGRPRRAAGPLRSGRRGASYFSFFSFLSSAFFGLSSPPQPTTALRLVDRAATSRRAARVFFTSGTYLSLREVDETEVLDFRTEGITRDHDPGDRECWNSRAEKVTFRRPSSSSPRSSSPRSSSLPSCRRPSSPRSSSPRSSSPR